MTMVCRLCHERKGACRCRSFWVFGMYPRWEAEMPLLWEGDQA